jgi:membrane protein involved in colicin uptake
MRWIVIGAILIISQAAALPAASALTPTQATAAANKARAELQAKQRAEALAKAKADIAAKARADAAAKSKAKALTLLGVRAETSRRIEAARKAAEANAKVTSFRATGSSAAPGPIHRGPGQANSERHVSGARHSDEPHARPHGATHDHATSHSSGAH